MTEGNDQLREASDRTRFVALDSWRGLAALLVTLFHFRSTSHISATPFVLHSWLFVDFFFVLSGVVISHSYFTRLGTPLQVQQFVIQRFGRLYPLHIAILGLYILSDLLKYPLMEFAGLQFRQAPFTHSHSIDTIFTNALMIQSLGVHDFLTWNEPSWSISAEFFVYLVFAAIMFFTRSPRIWLFGTILGSVLFALVFAKTGFGANEKFGFFRALYGFCIGHFVWIAFNMAKCEARIAALLKRHALLFELAAVVGALAFVESFENPDAIFLGPLVFGVTIFVFAFEQGPLSKMLKTAPLQRLGALSYSIYMVHSWLIWLMGLMLDQIADKLFHFRYARPVDGNLFFGTTPWNGDLLTVVFLLAVLAMANATYEWIEKPGRDAFKALSARLAERHKAGIKGPASAPAG